MSELTNPGSASIDATGTYISAILGLLGDRDPWDILRRTPDAVRDALREIPEPALRRPEAPGKWSLAQVVQHLADTELVWGWRLRMIIAHDHPPITGFDQDLWAARLGYADAPVGDALDQLDLLRRGNLRLVEAVPEAERHTRAGVHAERGDETLAHMIRLQAGHDLAHLRQIERIGHAVC
jgi:uncharacterized damage-inducible protein DinB